MSKSKRAYVAGPLQPYARGYRRELVRQGYSPWTTVAHLNLMAHLSRWLNDQQLTPAELNAARVAAFLTDRRASGQVRRLTVRGLIPLLGYLRGLGVVPAASIPAPAGPRQELLGRYATFLREDRGLAEGTIRWYLHVAELFLSDRVNERADVARLSGADVTAFVLAQVEQRGAGSLNNLVTGLRALLGFFYVGGYTAVSLVPAAPATVGWRDRGTSRGLAPEQVARLLASCDRRTNVGRRDFAVLTVLARLGLRANEVATLRVEDVDWHAGELTVHGKGNRCDRLPLPVDVGQAIAGYCRRGRPRGGCRSLFVDARAPKGCLI
jgi:integrase/recombinase XerD